MLSASLSTLWRRRGWRCWQYQFAAADKNIMLYSSVTRKQSINEFRWPGTWQAYNNVLNSACSISTKAHHQPPMQSKHHHRRRRYRHVFDLMFSQSWLRFYLFFFSLSLSFAIARCRRYHPLHTSSLSLSPTTPMTTKFLCSISSLTRLHLVHAAIRIRT